MIPAKKFRLKAPHVLVSGLTFRPVVTATERRKNGACYVLLAHEDRSELFREFGIDPPQRGLDTLPVFFPGTKINEGGERAALDSGHYYWLNAEDMWVRSTMAEWALRGLAQWRERHPESGSCIHAPSWRALTVVRMLALADGRPDPMRTEDLR
jgi:hypothetical protein